MEARAGCQCCLQNLKTMRLQGVIGHQCLLKNGITVASPSKRHRNLASRYPHAISYLNISHNFILIGYPPGLIPVTQCLETPLKHFTEILSEAEIRATMLELVKASIDKSPAFL